MEMIISFVSLVVSDMFNVEMIISFVSLVVSVIAVTVSISHGRASRRDQTCTILFNLLDEYKQPELNQAMKAFLEEKDLLEKDDEEYQNKLIYDVEFHERIDLSKANESKRQTHIGLNDEYRQLIYFWRKVALAHKMKYIDKGAIFAAFHNMEVLDILVPAYWGYCTYLNQDATMDDNFDELRKAYYEYKNMKAKPIERPNRKVYEHKTGYSEQAV